MRQERALQEAIVHALRLAGYEVLQTTAWRQKGPSGVSPGIPDLLVGHRCVGEGCLIGLEVKTPVGKLSPAQKEVAKWGLVVCRSVADALVLAYDWLLSMSTAQRVGFDHSAFAAALAKARPSLFGVTSA